MDSKFDLGLSSLGVSIRGSRWWILWGLVGLATGLSKLGKRGSLTLA